jgi:hypothetical protein
MREEINKLMFNNFFIQIEELHIKNQEQHEKEGEEIFEGRRR